MRKLLVAMLLVPLATFAQGPAAGTGASEANPGKAAGGPPGEGRWKERKEHMEMRMKLIRTVGLAEALNLDTAKALELGQVLDKQDARRQVIRKQLWEAAKTLRRAAKGETVSAADVNQAIDKGLQAREQMNQLDRETVKAVTKGLSPEQTARAVLFLAHLQRHFREMMMHGGPMHHGPGMMPGMMKEHMGPGGSHEMGLEDAGPGGGHGMVALGAAAPPDDLEMADVPFDGGPDIDAP